MATPTTASLPGAAARVAAVAAAACALALVAAPAAEAARACQAANAVPAKASKRTVMRGTLCLLNAHRARRDLRPLRRDRRLSRAARRHARDMARRKYFSHRSLSGATFVERVRRAGYLRRARRWLVGENLAWGVGARSTPQAVVRSWMRAPGHRANILTRSFREIGIGVARGAPVRRGGWRAGTYAVSFGVRR